MDIKRWEMRNKKGLWGAAEYRTNKAGIASFVRGWFLDTLCNPPLSTSTEENHLNRQGDLLF
jgi:hypothetical protein